MKLEDSIENTNAPFSLRTTVYKLRVHTHKEAIESLSVSVSVAPPFLRLGDVDLSLIFSGGKPMFEKDLYGISLWKSYGRPCFN